MTIRSLKLGIMAALLAVSALSTGGAQRGAGQRQGGPGRGNREQLEQNFRVQLSKLLRTQLGLNDDQMRQLSDVNQRFDVQRRDMLRREMTTRRSLREEVMKQDSADGGRIEQLVKEQVR